MMKEKQPKSKKPSKLIGTWVGQVTKAKSREEAITKLFSRYDAFPGKRKEKAQDAFFVVRTRLTRGGYWFLWVRKRHKRDGERQIKEIPSPYKYSFYPRLLHIHNAGRSMVNKKAI